MEVSRSDSPLGGAVLSDELGDLRTMNGTVVTQGLSL
jgi:hypothetical protein